MSIIRTRTLRQVSIKLDNHAVRTIFVGYGDPHGYKLFDPKSKRFIFRQRVIFDEDNLISSINPHQGPKKIQHITPYQICPTPNPTKK